MDHVRVNLLQGKPVDHPQIIAAPPKRRRTLLFTGVVFFVAVAGFVLTNVVLPSVRLSASFGDEGFWASFKHLTLGGDRLLEGQDEDRINVLLLGVGGPGHDGPLLTDTIMVASLQPSTGQAALLSVPRDLFIPYPDGQWRKVNEAYSLTEDPRPGTGGGAAAHTIGAVLGLRIPYYVRIDFRGFEKIIDEVGGVTINVDRTFTDATFPTDRGDGTISTVSFTAGWHRFSGREALQFARSRHGTNGEGSDFARARRQQKLLLTIKDQILSSHVLLNPLAVNRLATNLGGSIQTNLEPWELLTLYRMAAKVDGEQIVRASLDTTPAGLLADRIAANGAYILQPRNGNWEAVQRLAQEIFTAGRELSLEPARLEVQNGTNLSGLAASSAAKAERLGFTVVAVRNAEERPVQETVVYDLTSGAKPAALAALRLAFNARVIPVAPDWLAPSVEAITPGDQPRPVVSSAAREADFIIILGADAAPITPDGNEAR